MIGVAVKVNGGCSPYTPALHSSALLTPQVSGPVGGRAYTGPFAGVIGPTGLITVLVEGSLVKRHENVTEPSE